MKKEKPEKDNLKKKLRKNRIASTVMAIFIVICIIIGCSPTTRNAIRNSTPKEIKYENMGENNGTVWRFVLFTVLQSTY